MSLIIWGLPKFICINGKNSDSWTTGTLTQGLTKANFGRYSQFLFDSSGGEDEHTLVIFFDTVKQFLFLQ
jgi:hypothetical protein